MSISDLIAENKELKYKLSALTKEHTIFKERHAQTTDILNE